MQMKRSCIVLFSFLMFVVTALSGCDEKTNPVSKVGDSLVGAYERSSAGADQATLNGIRDAIRAYYITHRGYPASLDEIQDLMNSPIDSSRYAYDPDTGMIDLLE